MSSQLFHANATYSNIHARITAEVAYLMALSAAAISKDMSMMVTDGMVWVFQPAPARAHPPVASPHAQALAI